MRLKDLQLVLLENEKSLRSLYMASLSMKRFKVNAIKDGVYLEPLLRENQYDVIVSDTDLIELDGDQAVRSALEKELLFTDRTMIFAISDDPENEKYWKGLAHQFYLKSYLEIVGIGDVVKRNWNQFQCCDAAKKVMPKLPF